MLLMPGSVWSGIPIDTRRNRISEQRTGTEVTYKRVLQEGVLRTEMLLMPGSVWSGIPIDTRRNRISEQPTGTEVTYKRKVQLQQQNDSHLFMIFSVLKRIVCSISVLVNRRITTEGMPTHVTRGAFHRLSPASFKE
ncbi:hypothetical protein FKM82_010102 [Ascaphus truei]